MKGILGATAGGVQSPGKEVGLVRLLPMLKKVGRIAILVAW